MTRPQPSPLAWLLLVLLGLIWGGSFLANAVALTGFTPLWIAAARIGIAATILIGLALATGDGLPALDSAQGRRIWLHCIGMGLFSNALPFALLAWGQRQVTSGFAGITMAVVPLLVLPLAHFLVPGERMTPRRTIGFVVGFVGVVLLVGSGGDAGADDASALARLACIVAAGCYAVGAIVTRRAPPGPYLAFSAGALLVGAVLIVPVALAVDGLPADPPAAALAAVSYLGVLPTAVATIMLVFVIQTAGPSFMSLVNYQVPVWAVVLGLFFLGEEVPAHFLGALGLILAGLAVSQFRIGRPRRTPDRGPHAT